MKKKLITTTIIIISLLFPLQTKPQFKNLISGIDNIIDGVFDIGFSLNETYSVLIVSEELLSNNGRFKRYLERRKSLNEYNKKQVRLYTNLLQEEIRNPKSLQRIKISIDRVLSTSKNKVKNDVLFLEDLQKSLETYSKSGKNIKKITTNYRKAIKQYENGIKKIDKGLNSIQKSPAELTKSINKVTQIATAAATGNFLGAVKAISEDANNSKEKKDREKTLLELKEQNKQLKENAINQTKTNQEVAIQTELQIKNDIRETLEYSEELEEEFIKEIKKLDKEILRLQILQRKRKIYEENLKSTYIDE